MVGVREAAKKVFLSGPATKALPPSPRAYWPSELFFFFSFFSRKHILKEKNFPQNFWTKRAIILAKYCNKPVKKLRLCHPTT